jgi:hypothetical protein
LASTLNNQCQVLNKLPMLSILLFSGIQSETPQVAHLNAMMWKLSCAFDCKFCSLEDCFAVLWFRASIRHCFDSGNHFEPGKLFRRETVLKPSEVLNPTSKLLCSAPMTGRALRRGCPSLCQFVSGSWIHLLQAIGSLTPRAVLRARARIT